VAARYCVEHLRIDVHQIHYIQHKNVAMQVEKQDKTMKLKPTKHTKMLLGSVENKFEKPKTEGQECEGREVELGHLEKAVDFIEVVGAKVARMVSMKVLEILAIVAMNVVEDKNNVVKRIMMTATKFPTIQGSPSLKHLRVNLAGRSAGNHPGQSRKDLWVRYNTIMVVQQQIISWVKQGEVMDLVGGTRVAWKIYKLYEYRKYRQVLKDIMGAEVMANKVKTNPGFAVVAEGDSEDKQKFNKFEGFLSLFRSKLHKQRPGGVPRSVYRWSFEVEHMVSHARIAMATQLFLWQPT